MRDQDVKTKQRGATTVEYALLIAGMLVVSTTAVSQLGSSSADQFATAQAAMETDTGGDCPEGWKLTTTGNGKKKKQADANQDGFVCREKVNKKTERRPNGKAILNYRDNS